MEHITNIGANVVEPDGSASSRDATMSTGIAYPGNELLQEGLTPTALFNLTDRLTIFTYLVNSNRIRWYRVIMRVFLQHHRDLYHYQLTASEVRDAVRAALEPEYTLEQCQNDLASLKEWGNITTIYDASRATSIASFLAPALLYQATPEAIAIETFLEEQTRISAAKGSLRQSDLPRLWASLEQLNKDIPAHALELPAQSREIAEEWQRAFEVWNTMAREAAQYLANMINAAQQDRADLAAYQIYKAAVVAYVHGFAQALTQYARRVRELLHEWSINGKKEQLIQIVAQYIEPPAPTLESRATTEELAQEACNQVEALSYWFAEGKNADSFRRNALSEVDKVVRRASSLAASARPSANYATHLNTLAHLLLKARDGEAAQQLFSVAFANLLPVHLAEGLTGSASAAYEAGQHGKLGEWQEPPAVTLRLRPVSRTYRGDPPMEDPVIDNRTIIRAMIVQHERKAQEQIERFTRLFARTYLDLGTMTRFISAEDRTMLMEIVDACLTDPYHQYRAPDGSTILLHNYEEQTYATLRSRDGTLFIPRYRLERQLEEASSTETTEPYADELVTAQGGE
ncbi:MAG: DUF2397 domain-containing protein [Ktedonobacteraceae bacterium]